MSSWYIPDLFAGYSNTSYVSESNDETVLPDLYEGVSCNKGNVRPDLNDAVSCNEERVLPDLNEEFVDEAEFSYAAQSYPRYVYETNHSVLEKQHNRFKGWLPSLYLQYITHIEDAVPDGNCGFRSIAMSLGWAHDQWLFVRQQLLDEMLIHRAQWMHIFNVFEPNYYNEIYNSINWMRVAPTPVEYWMVLPYTGLLIAQKFGIIVQHLSAAGCQTYFPMFSGPDIYPNHDNPIISIAYVEEGHFIMVKLAEGCPMPRPNGLWIRYASTAAKEWETLYAPLISQYETIMSSNKKKYYINNLF